MVEIQCLFKSNHCGNASSLYFSENNGNMILSYRILSERKHCGNVLPFHVKTIIEEIHLC